MEANDVYLVGEREGLKTDDWNAWNPGARGLTMGVGGGRGGASSFSFEGAGPTRKSHFIGVGGGMISGLSICRRLAATHCLGLRRWGLRQADSDQRQQNLWAT